MTSREPPKTVIGKAIIIAHQKSFVIKTDNSIRPYEVIIIYKDKTQLNIDHDFFSILKEKGEVILTLGENVSFDNIDKCHLLVFDDTEEKYYEYIVEGDKKIPFNNISKVNINFFNSYPNNKKYTIELDQYELTTIKYILNNPNGVNDFE